MMNFDPSKLDPKTLMELSQIVQQLPPHQIQKMQSLMHNMMAGFDVKKEMEEFERSLPSGFREKIFSVMATQAQAAPSTQPMAASSTGLSAEEMSLREARLTILRAVAEGTMSPDQAEGLLFPQG